VPWRTLIVLFALLVLLWGIPEATRRVTVWVWDSNGLHREGD
jgi:hypothetical protein